MEASHLGMEVFGGFVWAAFLWIMLRINVETLVAFAYLISQKGFKGQVDPERDTLIMQLGILTTSIVAEPFIVAYQYVNRRVTAISENPMQVVYLVMSGVLAYAMLEHHRIIVMGVDSLYETIYAPILVPVKHVVNLIRLVFDLFIGLSNAVSHGSSIPTKALIETAGNCMDVDGAGDVRGILGTIADLCVEFAQRLAEWVLDPLSEINLVGFFQIIRTFISNVANLSKCVCDGSFVEGFVDAVFGFTTTTQFERFFHNLFNVILDFARIPIKAIATTFPANAPVQKPVLEVSQFFGHVASAIDAAGKLVDVEMSGIVAFLQDGVISSDNTWTWVPLFETGAYAFNAVVELAHIAARTVFEIHSMVSFIMIDADNLLNTGPDNIRAHELMDTSDLKNNIMLFSEYATIHVGGGLSQLFVPFCLSLHALNMIGIETLFFGVDVMKEFAIGPDMAYYDGPSLAEFAQQESLYFGESACNGGCGWPVRRAEDMPSLILFVNRFMAVLNNNRMRYALNVHNSVETFLDVLKTEVLQRYVVNAANSVYYFSSVINESYRSIYNRFIYVVHYVMNEFPRDTTLVLSPCCLNAYMLTYRLEMELVAKSLPELAQFFIDPGQSFDSGYVAAICNERTVHNFVYSGTSKAYNLASQACTAAYSSGLPIKYCSYEDPAMCPNPITEPYALKAYSDFQTNPVCALTEFGAHLLLVTLQNEAVLYDNIHNYATRFLNCAASGIAFDVCDVSDLIPYPKAFFDIMTCNWHEYGVRVANVLTSFLSLLVQFIYAAPGVDYNPSGYLFDGTEILNSPDEVPLCNTYSQSECEASWRNTKQCRWINSENECIVTCSRARMYDSSDEANRDPITGHIEYTTSDDINGVCGDTLYRGGWDNQNGHTEPVIDCSLSKAAFDKCHSPYENPLVYQPYPIEAATSALVSSLLHPIFFWPTHALNQTYSMYYNTLEEATDVNSNNVVQTLIASTLDVMAKPREIAVIVFRNNVLMIRDVLVELVQFVRSIVYVASSNTLSNEFVAFQEATSSILNVMQLLVAQASDFFMESVQNLIEFVMHIINAVFSTLDNDTSGAEKSLGRAFQLVLDFFASGQQILQDMLYAILRNIQGLGDFLRTICEILNKVTSSFVTNVCAMLTFKMLPSNVELQCLYFTGEATGDCLYGGSFSLFPAAASGPPASKFSTSDDFESTDKCVTSNYFYAESEEGSGRWLRISGRTNQKYFDEPETEPTYSAKTIEDVCWNSRIYGETFPCLGHGTYLSNSPLRLRFDIWKDRFYCKNIDTGAILAWMYPRRDVSERNFAVPYTCSGETSEQDRYGYEKVCEWSDADRYYSCEWVPKSSNVIEGKQLCAPIFDIDAQTCVSTRYTRTIFINPPWGNSQSITTTGAMVEIMSDEDEEEIRRCRPVHIDFDTGNLITKRHSSSNIISPIPIFADYRATYFSADNIPFGKSVDVYDGLYGWNPYSSRRLLSLESNSSHVDDMDDIYFDVEIDETSSHAYINRHVYLATILLELAEYPFVPRHRRDNRVGTSPEYFSPDARIAELVTKDVFLTYDAAEAYLETVMANTTLFKQEVAYSLLANTIAINEHLYAYIPPNISDSTSIVMQTNTVVLIKASEANVESTSLAFCITTNQTIRVTLSEIPLSCIASDDGSTIMHTQTMGEEGVNVFYIKYADQLALPNEKRIIDRTYANFDSYNALNAYNATSRDILLNDIVGQNYGLSSEGIRPIPSMSSATYHKPKFTTKNRDKLLQVHYAQLISRFVKNSRMDIGVQDARIWGSVTSFVEGAWNAASDPFEEISKLWDEIRDLQKDVISALDFIGNIDQWFQNEMTKFLDSLLDEVLKFLDGNFGGYIPVYPEIELGASIESVFFQNNELDTFCEFDGLTCDDPTFNTDDAVAAEATVCNSWEGAECAAADAQCWVQTPSDCLGRLDDGDMIKSEVAMVYACPCTNVRGGDVHCNIASGYCQAGQTPFTPPIQPTNAGACPDLLPSIDLYDTGACYVTPAYLCEGIVSAADMDQCRYMLMQNSDYLHGPYLCREYCDPTRLNENNWFTSVERTWRSGAMCVCEIGMDIALSHIDNLNAYTLTRKGNVLSAPASRRRALLEAPPGSNLTSADMSFMNLQSGEAAFSHTVFATPSADAPAYQQAASANFAARTIKTSHCEHDSDCKSIYSSGYTSIKFCRGSSDALMPCPSCPYRSALYQRTGYKCDAATKQCVCSSHKTSDVLKRASTQQDHAMTTSWHINELWDGDSMCDRIVRGYSQNDNMTALEEQEVLRCLYLRHYGHKLRESTGLHTLPTDLFYNPTRWAELAQDAFITASVVVNGGFWNGGTSDFALAEILRSKHVDPHLSIGVLNMLRRSLSPLYAAQHMQIHISDDTRLFFNQSLAAHHAVHNIWNAMSQSNCTTCNDVNATNNIIAGNRRLLDDKRSYDPYVYEKSTVLFRGLKGMEPYAGTPSCPAIETTQREFERVAYKLRDYYQDVNNEYVNYGICDFLRATTTPTWEANGCGDIVAAYHAKHYAPQSMRHSTNEFTSRYFTGKAMVRVENTGYTHNTSHITSDFEQLAPKSTRAGFGSPEWIVDLITDLSGFDWKTFTRDVVDFFTRDPSTSSGDEDEDTARRAFRCDDSEAIMCKLRREGHTLVDSTRDVIFFELTIALLAYFMLGRMGTIVMTLCIALAVPVTFFGVAYLHYNVSPVCMMRFIPSVPVCLMDDIYYTLEHDIFPRKERGKPLSNPIPFQPVHVCYACMFAYASKKRSLTFAHVVGGGVRGGAEPPCRAYQVAKGVGCGRHA